MRLQEYHGSLSRRCKIQARDSFLRDWDSVLEQSKTRIMRRRDVMMIDSLIQLGSRADAGHALY